MDKTLIIISDLHIGVGDEFDIFAGAGKYELFDSFARHCKETPGPVELIVNGDFVDFLQLRPWDDHSRGAALSKIKRIVAGSKRVFESLATFLRGTPHELVIMLGNHDVELAYPEVGEVLTGEILRGAPDAESRLRLIDRRTTYNPRVNGVLVHVEHGNGGDPWNAINYNTLFRDAELRTDEHRLPPGTALVYETMNGFKQHFRFVDLLKPEVPAVPILLLTLKPLKAAVSLPGFLKTALDSRANGFAARLREKVVGRALGPSPSGPAVLSQAEESLLEECVRAVPPDAGVNPGLIEEYLAGEGVDEPEAAGGTKTLGPHSQAAKLKLLSWGLRGLARYKAGNVGESFYVEDHPADAAAKGARSLFTGDVQIVVFGHTHEALKTEFPEGLYVNSGTWANLIGMPKANAEELLAWYRQLAENTFPVTANPTFVRIGPSARGVAVSLNSWDVAGSRTLFQKEVPRRADGGDAGA